ncbi:two component transcriptional regulator, winged helix family [Leadbetterella byssophila DSM 17132]|uniref:Two component transcriptional regulator, winged helix family n=1 Tax=Leadbetterella byssophila (strain DSM 17132 / JCM 16389 / KACC 11308 / NBRC 106382 / 4M15) TaxID=649349 RepID=E4RRG3_LEAB4|nr:response regulator transcription factor [Leadbetterella byssophila]ADQ18496.1 two component transcriptional regulator, winged helix family [Leadbetterella byssophila DSM 17132]
MKILYVEDEIFLGKIVKETLESRGFEISMVTDGAHAITEFRKFNPEVCVLDIMLPHKNGFEIAEEIRVIDPMVPILFLTAKSQVEDVLKGFGSGGNDYLKKPFSMEELIVRIQNLKNLVGKKKEVSDAVSLSTFTFYPTKQELVSSLKEPIKLSFRESELLKVLAENVNQKVLRKDILMRVWNDDSYFNSRNLDVYITRLRDYFKNDSGVEIITLKGVGYLFKVEG